MKPTWKTPDSASMPCGHQPLNQKDRRPSSHSPSSPTQNSTVATKKGRKPHCHSGWASCQGRAVRAGEAAGTGFIEDGMTA